ncbi:MAG TPA: Crp/Fnr family transcriptional regulator [Anaeromyxobacteraceae bacterium]|nr:Crp/Fnr family transcriptional regulator [Anaeromyxobacteraceae bacterium]
MATTDRPPSSVFAREFPVGAVIFEEGDPGSRMYVIQGGRVLVVKSVGGRSLALASLGPGDFFGEMALLEGQPRSATAVVAEAARILELDEQAFADLLRGNGEVGLKLLRKLSARLRDATRRIRNFLAADAMGRAVEVLRALCGPAAGDGWRPAPDDLEVAELASRAGESPERARELWGTLERAGLVRHLGSRRELAPAETVSDFLRYLEMKPRYDAIAQAELAEVSGLGEEPVESILAELFHARLLPDGADSGLGALARGWHEFVDLERRFGGR